MALSNETKVGILAITSLAILFFGYNFLKGNNVFGKERSYFAEYKRVDGLLVSNPVQINGYQIGVVEDIYLKEKDPSKIVVKFSITEDIKVFENDTARIISTSLLGDKALEIKLGKLQDRVNELQSGNYLTGNEEASMFAMIEKQLIPTQQKIEALVVSIDTLVASVDTTVNSVNEILSSEDADGIMSEVQASVAKVGEALDGLEGLIKGMEGITGSLDNFTKNDLNKISNTLSDVEKLSGELAGNTEKFGSIIANTDALTSRLADVPIDDITKDLKGTIKQVNGVVGQVNGTLGQVNGLVASAGGTVKELESTVKSVGDEAAKAMQSVTPLIGTMDTVLTSFKGAGSIIDTIEIVLSDTKQVFTDLGSSTNELLDSLGGVMTNADSSIVALTMTLNQANDLIGQINSGEGTVGKIFNDESLYSNLDSITTHVDSLMIDFKANPQRYVHFSLFSGKKWEERQKRKAARRAKRGK